MWTDLTHVRVSRGSIKATLKRSSASAKANKQGAYGKVPTHSHSKADQLTRPLEVAAGLYVKLMPGALPLNLKVTTEEERFCDKKLEQVSRSFAAVIRQLPTSMAMDILIFYLVLRGEPPAVLRPSHPPEPRAAETHAHNSAPSRGPDGVLALP